MGQDDYYCWSGWGCEGNTISAVALKRLLLPVRNACEQIVIGREEIVRFCGEKKKLQKRLLNSYSSNSVILETLEIVEN